MRSIRPTTARRWVAFQTEIGRVPMDEPADSDGVDYCTKINRWQSTTVEQSTVFRYGAGA